MTQESAAAAHVVGSAIVVFMPGDVADQDQEDVCNSLEFSLRATRRQFTEPEHIKEWEGALFSSLSTLHWFLQSSDIPEKQVDLPNLLKEIRLSDAEQRLVQQAIDVLASKMENSDALKVFNSRVAMPPPSSSDVPSPGIAGSLSTLDIGQGTNQQTSANDGDTQARYQIVVCSVQNGAIAAKFASCQFVGPTFLSNVLFPQSLRLTKIRISASTRGLNLGSYAADRDQIKQRLGTAGPSTQAKIVLATPSHRQ
ncbi:hypothetical protein BD779DRAFT_561819 [Infundibulicybe gibba]|nr:hypothetical protein BD779DRAFT_561819 [Infundibulicybe gibba]